MAYDERVADRLRKAFGRRPDLAEKRMFGGIAFMLHGNMCCGVLGNTLMARVGPAQYDEALSRPHAREMNFTGRSMKGFVYVESEGFETDEDLKSWVSMCEKFVMSLPAK